MTTKGSGYIEHRMVVVETTPGVHEHKIATIRVEGEPPKPSGCGDAYEKFAKSIGWRYSSNPPPKDFLKAAIAKSAWRRSAIRHTTRAPAK